jgi:hypothetical protein
MKHLSAGQLIDALEGLPPAHLETCASCRARLEELQATMAAAESVGVPEPSPLFWQHFSRRVHEATARESVGPSGWLSRLLFHGPWWVVTGAAAVAVLAVFVGVRELRPAPVRNAVASASEALTADGIDVPGPTDNLVDDSSLSFVADLAAGLDWDGFGEAGLTPAIGGVDRALDQLSDGERDELRRLLAVEIGRPGA